MHREAFLYIMKAQIAAPKPDGSRLQSKKKHDFEALFKRKFTGKITSAKIEKSANKSLSQPSCSHSNTIHDMQLQKTMVLRKQPQQRGTLMQPLHCHLRRQSCKTQLQNKVSVPKRNKNDSLRFTTLSCKRHKYFTRSGSSEEPWCSHYNAFSSIS